MSTNTEPGGEEQPAADDEPDEWVEQRREQLERLANSGHNSAWVADRMLQSDDEEEGES